MEIKNKYVFSKFNNEFIKRDKPYNQITDDEIIKSIESKMRKFKKDDNTIIFYLSNSDQSWELIGKRVKTPESPTNIYEDFFGVEKDEITKIINNN